LERCVDGRNDLTAGSAAVFDDIIPSYLPSLTYVSLFATPSFSIVSTATIAVNLYVTVCCAILDQEGRVTRALAIARGDKDQTFESDVEKWYGDASFSAFRTKLFWMYIASMPAFCASIGLLCLLKMPPGPGICSASILLVTAFFTTKTLLWINHLFREQILGLAKGQETHAPKVAFGEECEE
jgi:hypothetical protein